LIALPVWELWVTKRNYVWRFMELWRAISDEKAGCTSLLTTKYEPVMIKLTEKMTSQNGDFQFFCEKCHVGDVAVGGR